MVILLRTLTPKSKIGFGVFKECTVDEIIRSGKHKELINIYYRLANVTFTEEVLGQLDIPERVSKPGKKVELAITAVERFQMNHRVKGEEVRSVTKALEVYHVKQSNFRNRQEMTAHSLAWRNQGHKQYS